MLHPNCGNMTSPFPIAGVSHTIWFPIGWSYWGELTQLYAVDLAFRRRRDGWRPHHTTKIGRLPFTIFHVQLKACPLLRCDRQEGRGLEVKRKMNRVVMLMICQTQGFLSYGTEWATKGYQGEVIICLAVNTRKPSNSQCHHGEFVFLIHYPCMKIGSSMPEIRKNGIGSITSAGKMSSWSSSHVLPSRLADFRADQGAPGAPGTLHQIIFDHMSSAFLSSRYKSPGYLFPLRLSFFPQDATYLVVISGL
jgi:hypothetical protein